MLLFNPGGLRSQAQELRSKLGNLLFGVRHLRTATACLILSFWFVWIIVLSELLYSYPVWPFEACLSSLECSAFSLIVGLHAAVLFPGTVGWMCSCPILTALLVVPPLCFGGAISGIVVSYWMTDDSDVASQLTSTVLLAFGALWIVIVYAVIVIGRYCDYLKTVALLRRRRCFNIDVFKERVFGTPPLKEFNRMEFARCSNLSDSLIDDIFGDYEPNVTLH